MPLFDFKCARCGESKKDVLLPMKHTEASVPVCCDETMTKQWTAANAAFVGKGFYRNDYQSATRGY